LAVAHYAIFALFIIEFVIVIRPFKEAVIPRGEKPTEDSLNHGDFVDSHRLATRDLRNAFEPLCERGRLFYTAFLYYSSFFERKWDKPRKEQRAKPSMFALVCYWWRT
jgi:hypothetical protein